MNAISVEGEVDETGEKKKPRIFDYVMHVITLPWKLLCALLPPNTWLGGWLAFISALVIIGFQTYLVSEFATLFGCVIGLKDAITGITIVALGGSLPDTFASKQAAEKGETADDSVGNVTGSNAVNVFVGLGLPWMIASIWYAVHSDEYPGGFQVPAAGLGFTVALFLVCSVLFAILILSRRFLGAGELGGNVVFKWVSGVILVILWLAYIVLSSLRAYNII